MVAVAVGELWLRSFLAPSLILKGAPASRNQMIASPALVAMAGISNLPACDNPGI
jgi:hypothetical protein